MGESPIRKKTPATKTGKTTSKKTPHAEVLKEALSEVRGLEAAILEDVVIDPDALPISDSAEEITESVDEAPAEIAAETPQIPVEQPAEQSTPIVTKKPQKPYYKRRKVRYAAPLGFAVLVLAIVGVVSLFIGSIGLIKSWTDDSELRAELSEFLYPVTQVWQEPFEDAGKVKDQSALVNSAIFSIVQPEYVRSLNEGENAKLSYKLDSLGRLIIPKSQVEQAFSKLFGDKKIRTHQTINDIDYNEQTKCYHVPLQLPTAGFVPVVDTIDCDDDVYTVRVAYVLAQDIQYDYRGTAIEPTADMGKYAQLFLVKKNEDDSWTILSVAAEEQ